MELSSMLRVSDADYSWTVRFVSRSDARLAGCGRSQARLKAGVSCRVTIFFLSDREASGEIFKKF
jgi:hypothetical protein